MSYDPTNPLIVQSDLSMLLEVNSPKYDEVRDSIAPFAEIIKSPEHVHTYRISPISLWNAASSGMKPEQVIERLMKYSRFEIASNIVDVVRDLMGRYGKVRLETFDEQYLQLIADTPLLMERFWHIDAIQWCLEKRLEPTVAIIKKVNRGILKQAFIKEGYPVMDVAGYVKGDDLDIDMKPQVELRPYQIASRDSFLKGGSHLGGCGVIVLPCGAGKTIVGMSVMASMKTHTLILVTGTAAARQWRQELLNKTSISEDMIGEFSGAKKEIKPVTIATYHILTHRSRGSDEGSFTHFDKINNNPWGLIIYDEVHLLPAQVFRFTASLQAIRRLGLTATLIREDHKEIEVFSLIGPKSYDVAWKEVEKQGWIAEALCHEIRVELDVSIHEHYATSPKGQRFRISSENPAKYAVVQQLVGCHPDENILIIGQYIKQLETVAEMFALPIITGKTPQDRREQLYDQFRRGEIKVLVVSSVANFSIDLPEASIAIQISGRFGSRQEEAQRLGRILRPKASRKQAKFYTIVTAGTEEQDFALNRQMFLTEQGYNYIILDEEELKPFLRTEVACSN